MQKKSFVIYKDWLPLVSALYEQDKALVGELFVSLMRYQNSEEEPDVSNPIYPYFAYFKAMFDRDNAKYDAACKRNRENGRLGGRPQKPTETQNNPVGFFEAKHNPPKPTETQNNPQKPDNDNDNDNDNDRYMGEAPKPPVPFIDYDGIMKDYNDTCPSLSKVTTLSEARKKAIKARVNTVGLEKIHQAFVMAEESSFLKGGNNKNWAANFDWIMRDANMAKILDGNYADREKRQKDEGGQTAKKGNKFMNFEQREYGSAYYEDLTLRLAKNIGGNK